MRVTHVGADTVVSGIVALTTRAAGSKPRLARDGERAAAGFIARVLVLATCTAIGWAMVDPSHALAATVAVLVVACPCAFALAAPAAVTRALAVLTARGVLVVRPDALEDLLGMLIAGEDAFEVEDGQAAVLAHLDRQARLHVRRQYGVLFASWKCLEQIPARHRDASHRDALLLEALGGSNHERNLRATRDENDLRSVRLRVAQHIGAAAQSVG